MQPVQRENNDGARRAIGKLCVGADWACTTGDLGTLSSIAAELAAYVPEPLHCKLTKLADICRSDPDDAVAIWLQLKDALLHGERIGRGK